MKIYGATINNHNTDTFLSIHRQLLLCQYCDAVGWTEKWVLSLDVKIVSEGLSRIVLRIEFQTTGAEWQETSSTLRSLPLTSVAKFNDLSFSNSEWSVTH